VVGQGLGSAGGRASGIATRVSSASG